MQNRLTNRCQPVATIRVVKKRQLTTLVIVAQEPESRVPEPRRVPLRSEHPEQWLA